MHKNLKHVLEAAALTAGLLMLPSCGDDEGDDSHDTGLHETEGNDGTTAGCPGTTAGCPGTTAGCPGTTAGCPGTTAGCPTGGSTAGCPTATGSSSGG